jgi:hypothetical protein
MRVLLPLLLVAGLAPAQAGKFYLSNPRLTHGLLGPVRTDTKFLPGDSLYLAFEIDGIKVDEAGKAHYSMGLEVATSKGKVQFKQEPRNLEAIVPLGGARLPGHAHLDLGVEQPAGDYTLKVTVTDRLTKNSEVLSRNFQVLPKGLGLVRLRLTGDEEGDTPLPAVGVTGQSPYVQCGLVGFERDKSKKQPHLALEVRILDEKGKPTLPKPFTNVIDQNVPEKQLAIPIKFQVPLNRPGKFTIEMKATDQLSKKTAQLSFPYNVIDAK